MSSEAADAPLRSPAPQQPFARRRISFIVGIASFSAVEILAAPLRQMEGFGARPAHAAAVTLLMAVWWFTEAIPIAWTACVPLVLFPLLGVFGKGIGSEAIRTAESYADAYIFLFMGGMMIGAAMQQWNLHRRLALHIMHRVGTAPHRLLLGMLVATATVSLWISNTATAVMMMPIGMALLAQLEIQSGGRRLHRYGCALMLSVAYGANIGGIGTKIGTGTNSIFCGYLASHLGVDLDFISYMALGLPFVLLMMPAAWLILWLHGRGDRLGASQGKNVIEKELAAMGPMSAHEKAVALVFAVAAALWCLGDPIRRLLGPVVPELWDGFKFQNKHYESWVAIGAALALLATGQLSLAAIKRIPWGTLVLLGGSFAMAAGIEGSGLSIWIGRNLGRLGEAPILAQIAISSTATIILSAVASNTATINVMLNVLPRSLPVLASATLAASCDFMLPAGTPPNAIVFGSGYIRLPEMVRIGAVLDAIAALLVSLYGFYFIRPFFAGVS